MFCTLWVFVLHLVFPQSSDWICVDYYEAPVEQRNWKYVHHFMHKHLLLSYTAGLIVAGLIESTQEGKFDVAGMYYFLNANHVSCSWIYL